MSKLFVLTAHSSKGMPDRVLIEAKSATDALERYAAKLVTIDKLDAVGAASETRAGTPLLTDLEFTAGSADTPAEKAA